MDFFLVVNEALRLQTKSQLATSSLDSVGIAVEPRYVLFIKVFIYLLYYLFQLNFFIIK